MPARKRGPVRRLKILQRRIDRIRTDTRIFELQTPHVVTRVAPDASQQFRCGRQILRVKPGADRATDVKKISLLRLELWIIPLYAAAIAPRREVKCPLAFRVRAVRLQAQEIIDLRACLLRAVCRTWRELECVKRHAHEFRRDGLDLFDETRSRFEMLRVD